MIPTSAAEFSPGQSVAPGVTTPSPASRPVDYEAHHTGLKLTLGLPGSTQWRSPEVQGSVHREILKRLAKGDGIIGRNARTNQTKLNRCLWADIDRRKRPIDTWSDQAGPCDWCSLIGGDRQCAVMLDEETILIKNPITQAPHDRTVASNTQQE